MSTKSQLDIERIIVGILIDVIVAIILSGLTPPPPAVTLNVGTMMGDVIIGDSGTTLSPAGTGASMGECGVPV